MQRLYRMIYSKREHRMVAFLQQLEMRGRKRKVVLALQVLIRAFFHKKLKAKAYNKLFYKKSSIF